MMEIETVDKAIHDTGIKICVHGPAGVGKTVLASTCGAPTILLSAEAGLLSLSGVSDSAKSQIGVMQIHTSEDVGVAYNRLMAEKLADWVVIDSLSEIAEVLLSDKKKGVNDPRKAYGEMADEMMDMIRLFRDMPGYNVMMTAKQTRYTDGSSGTSMYIPMLPGKQVPDQIPYMFDELFALRVIPDAEGNMQRVLQTGRDVQYEAKDRSGKLAMYEYASIESIAAKIAAPIVEAAPASEQK